MASNTDAKVARSSVDHLPESVVQSLLKYCTQADRGSYAITRKAHCSTPAELEAQEVTWRARNATGTFIPYPLTDLLRSARRLSGVEWGSRVIAGVLADAGLRRALRTAYGTDRVACALYFPRYTSKRFELTMVVYLLPTEQYRLAPNARPLVPPAVLWDRMANRNANTMALPQFTFTIRCANTAPYLPPPAPAEQDTFIMFNSGVLPFATKVHHAKYPELGAPVVSKVKNFDEVMRAPLVALRQAVVRTLSTPGFPAAPSTLPNRYGNSTHFKAYTPRWEAQNERYADAGLVEWSLPNKLLSNPGILPVGYELPRERLTAILRKDRACEVASVAYRKNMGLAQAMDLCMPATKPFLSAFPSEAEVAKQIAVLSSKEKAELTSQANRAKEATQRLDAKPGDVLCLGSRSYPFQSAVRVKSVGATSMQVEVLSVASRGDNPPSFSPVAWKEWYTCSDVVDHAEATLQWHNFRGHVSPLLNIPGAPSYAKMQRFEECGKWQIGVETETACTIFTHDY